MKPAQGLKKDPWSRATYWDCSPWLAQLTTRTTSPGMEVSPAGWAPGDINQENASHRLAYRPLDEVIFSTEVALPW